MFCVSINSQSAVAVELERKRRTIKPRSAQGFSAFDRSTSASSLSRERKKKRKKFSSSLVSSTFDDSASSAKKGEEEDFDKNETVDNGIVWELGKRASGSFDDDEEKSTAAANAIASLRWAGEPDVVEAVSSSSTPVVVVASKFDDDDDGKKNESDGSINSMSTTTTTTTMSSTTATITSMTVSYNNNNNNNNNSNSNTSSSGYQRKWKKRDLAWARDAIPFYVMLPLDVVSRDGVLENKEVLEVALDALARVGVDGIMVDVWWGIVERKRPKAYDWKPYDELFQICKKLGLKVQAVMSFHACGANVGDVYEIKLPDWVLESGIQDPDLFFTDQYGYRNPECISLWADEARTVAGRTPRECYRDFMVSFRDTFADLLKSTISEIAVGCGPCGELRYPSYPENKRSPNSSQWQFPGIGEFQCYDQRALGALARHAADVGRIEWGGSGPHDVGGYNNLPQETGFFRADRGSWDSEYGQFFLDWYAKELVKHGDKTLQTTREVFDYEKTGVDVAIKCAGVHWWYNSRSHAAELTAGYFNTRSGDFVPERDGYEPIVKICAKYNARLNFTCVEMLDDDHPWFARCGPEGLLRQIRTAAAKHNVRVAGENALCRFDSTAYDLIIKNARGEGDDVELWMTGEKLPPMACFTFLRMSRELFQLYNFNSFKEFVKRMKAATVRNNLRLLSKTNPSSLKADSIYNNDNDNNNHNKTSDDNNNSNSNNSSDNNSSNNNNNSSNNNAEARRMTGNAYINTLGGGSMDDDEYDLEELADGFAEKGDAPELSAQVRSIVQLMSEL